MRQSHLIVNLDKKEFIHPFKLGSGTQLTDQMSAVPGTGPALLILLACSNGRSDGDLRGPDSVIGRWAGDRIAVIGDKARPDDLTRTAEAAEIYGRCVNALEGWEDISDLVAPIIEQELDGQ